MHYICVLSPSPKTRHELQHMKDHVDLWTACTAPSTNFKMHEHLQIEGCWVYLE